MALIRGFLIILCVLACESGAAFIQTEIVSQPSISGCSTTGNFTTCQSTSTGSFLGTLFSVTVSGFNDAPFVINFFWVLIMGGLLVVAIIDIVRYFIPFLPGGG